VALDIGHTPLKGGAISARGIFEYEFNRRLVQELFALLETSGTIQAIVINPEGEEISLTGRTTVANAQKADLFLAIHHDSVKDRFLKNWQVNGTTQKFCDDFHGYSIFVSNKNLHAAESLHCAEDLGEALLAANFTPTLHHAAQENRPLLDRAKGIYAFDDLVVLKTAKMPAVLLECGVIVNRNEEEKLNDSAYRTRLVEAIASAIKKFSTQN
jgi:N-acetylmuramoyl-L-alanine amidase